MKKTIAMAISALLAAALIAVAAAGAFASDKESRHERHIRMATELLEKMAAQNDSEAFRDTIKSCKGVAIFPAVVQAGLGIGGMNGGGVVLLRDGKGGWHGPSFAEITGGSFGLQIGVQKVGLLLCIVNEKGIPVFTGGEAFKLGADVGITAGPVGRNAEAATDTRAAASIYSYSMSEGAFAGLTFSGSSINVSPAANKAYWGESTSAKDALSRAAKGDKIKPLVDQLNKMSK